MCTVKIYTPTSSMLSEYNDMLSASDLSELFGVSKKTIYKEIRDGKFGTPIKIGRAFIVPKAFIISQFIANYL